MDGRHARPLLVGDERAGERVSAARSCRNARSTLSSESRNSGRNSAQAGKERDHSSLNCFRTRPACARLDEAVDVLDYPAVIAALEKQAPLWPPGTAHGYHARTFGFLLDELVRRIAGKTLERILARTFSPTRSSSISGSACRNPRTIACGHDLRRRKPASRPTPAAILSRPRHAGNAGPQNLYFAARAACRERHEQAGEPRDAVCFLRRDRQRHFAGKILRDAGERRRARRPPILQPETIAQMTTTLDSGHRSRLPNPDCLLRRIHERSAWTHTRRIFGPSPSPSDIRARGQPCLCRSGKRNLFRLRHEPDGAIALALTRNRCGSWTPFTVGTVHPIR